MHKSRILFAVSLFVLSLTGCTKSDQPKPHVHTFSEEWDSDETNHWHPSTCGHEVIDGEEAHTPGTAVRENENPATCTDDGSYEEVVYCSVCARELSRDYHTESATGHRWSTPTYTWNETNTECTASRYCLINSDHIETETTTDIEKTVVTSLDCEHDGEYTYTATFVNTAFSVTKNETVPTPGHAWGAPAYYWNIDYTECTARVTCQNNIDHQIAETVSTSYEVTTEPGVEENGVGTYSAAFENPLFETATRNITLPATGTPEKLIFTLSDDETYYSVKQASTSLNGTVVVPSEYEGKPVKRIDSQGFTAIQINRFVILDGVEVIGEQGISMCNNWKYARFPNTIKYLEKRSIEAITGAGCFNGYGNCSFVGNEENPYLILVKGGTKYTTSYTIPEGCKLVCDSAFNGSTSITSLSFPEGVIQLGNQAVYGCTSLETVELPTTLKYIGDSCFSRSKAKHYNLYEGLESIGTEAFALNNYLESINIPSTVKTINKNLFIGCYRLTEIVLNEGLETIDTYGLSDCSYITSLYLPSTLTSLGTYALKSCWGLTSLTIPNGITVIPERCFMSCSGLTEMILPASLTSIQYRAFENCSKLTTLTFQGTRAQWNSINLPYAWNSSSKLTSVICSDGTITLPEY